VEIASLLERIPLPLQRRATISAPQSSELCADSPAMMTGVCRTDVLSECQLRRRRCVGSCVLVPETRRAIPEMQEIPDDISR
jgi:hypothetical protein